MKAPRRPELPAKQRSSPGSGPAGPENFGYFPSLESSPPAGGISPKTKQRFRRCGGEFLSERSERNQRIAGGIVRKESAAAAPCAFAHDSPGPPFYGIARGVRRQLRPARKPREGCLNFITAALLNGPDRLLLQDNLRLSGAAYTVGAGRRAATRGRPYRGTIGRTMFPPAKCKTVRAAGFAVGSPYEKGPFRAPLPFSISSPPAIGGRSPPPQG